MSFLKHKLFPCLLAVVLLVSVLPMSVAAEEPTIVCDEQSINDAIAAIPDGGSGAITISNVMLGLANPISIYNKDVTFNLVNAQISTFMDEYGNGLPIIYSVDGNVVINADDASSMTMGAKGIGYGVVQVENSTYNTTTGAFDEEFTLTVNGGKYSCQEDDVVFVALPGTTVALTNVLAWGGIKTEDWAGTNINIPGELVIGNGCYYSDITDYVAEGKFICNMQNKYHVRDKEFSDEFKAAFPDNKFVFNAARPTGANDMTIMAICEQFNEQYAPEFFMYAETFASDFNTCEVVLNENTYKEEIHAFPVEWVYDAATKEMVDDIIANFPKGEEAAPGEFMPYLFKVDDMALINYWLTCNEETDNIGKLINYSEDFKKAIDYKNFFVDVRLGDGDYFYTFAGGLADFRYDDVSYAAKHLEVKAEHVLYVPTATANTPEAIQAAAEKRIKEYVGEGKVALTYIDTVYNMYDEEHFANTGDHLDPNLSWADELWVDDVDGDDHCYLATINGLEYTVIIKPNSEKMQNPTYLNVDLATDVSVSSDDASVPLDTLIQVDELVDSDERDALFQILGVEDGVTYDIKLHSGSLDQYVTKLENGKFEVKIPVPVSLEGKTLSAYYAEVNGPVTEYAATVIDGFAVFETDHFSIYTLAEAKTTGNAGGQGGSTVQPGAPQPETQKPGAQTGDKAPIAWLVVLVLVSGLLVATELISRKRKA